MTWDAQDRNGKKVRLMHIKADESAPTGIRVILLKAMFGPNIDKR